MWAAYAVGPPYFSLNHEKICFVSIRLWCKHMQPFMLSSCAGGHKVYSIGNIRLVAIYSSSVSFAFLLSSCFAFLPSYSLDSKLPRTFSVLNFRALREFLITGSCQWRGEEVQEGAVGRGAHQKLLLQLHLANMADCPGCPHLPRHGRLLGQHVCVERLLDEV